MMSGKSVELATARLMPDLFQDEHAAPENTAPPLTAADQHEHDHFDAMDDEADGGNSNTTVIALGLVGAAIAFAVVLAFPTKTSDDSSATLDDYLQVEATEKTWFQTLTGREETLEEWKQKKSYARATAIGHAQNKSSRMSRQLSESRRGYRAENGRVRKNDNSINGSGLPSIGR